jgi:copper transport protein
VSAGVRGIAFIVLLIVGLSQATDALAHASLIRAEPADGATLAEPPAIIKLTFNELVSPLVMRLIGPDGEVIAPQAVAENATVTVSPPRLRQGTHALSWRVVSADGHPVGGSLVFSVGAPSTVAQPGSQPAGDPLLRPALWLMKVLIYEGLFLGIGGVFFRAWLADPGASPAEAQARRWVFRIPAILAAGLAAALLSVGLQGLDALDLPLSGLTQNAVWQTGMATAYGLTAIAAVLALVAGIVALRTTSPRIARGLSILGLVGAGLALSLSGHAGTVEPRLMTRSAVFLHAVCVAMWVGAFVPLLAAIGDGGSHKALARFTRLIPYPLAILLATGVALVFVQLDRVDALWTTRYGIVLSFKLAAVAALLSLAVANRFVLVPRFEADGASTSRTLARSITFELYLALAILGLVAFWRFTPPPRALAAAEHASIHFHGARAMTQIEVEPKRGQGADVHVLVLDAEMRPLAVKEVTLLFSNPAVGIEPIRRNAVSVGDTNWRIDGVRIPVAGRWRLRVDILITDFDKETLEDDVELPQAP